MKKLITLLLAITMVLSLCACADSGESETTGSALGDGLNVGYSKVNITPDFSVGLGGYSDAETRKSEGYVD